MRKKQKLGVLLLLTLVFNLLLPIVSHANELLYGVSNFQYTADGDRGGAFPRVNTNEYNENQTSDFISNFNYGVTGYQDNPITKSIIAYKTPFDSGYHT